MLGAVLQHEPLVQFRQRAIRRPAVLGRRCKDGPWRVGGRRSIKKESRGGLRRPHPPAPSPGEGEKQAEGLRMARDGEALPGCEACCLPSLQGRGEGGGASCGQGGLRPSASHAGSTRDGFPSSSLQLAVRHAAGGVDSAVALHPAAFPARARSLPALLLRVHRRERRNSQPFSVRPEGRAPPSRSRSGTDGANRSRRRGTSAASLPPEVLGKQSRVGLRRNRGVGPLGLCGRTGQGFWDDLLRELVGHGFRFRAVGVRKSWPTW